MNFNNHFLLYFTLEFKKKKNRLTDHLLVTVVVIVHHTYVKLVCSDLSNLGFIKIMAIEQSVIIA